MTRLSEIHLDISDPRTSLDFYVQQLGMRLTSETVSRESAETVYSLAFETGARLKLRYREIRQDRKARYQPHDSDAYWKIGITIADVGMACERLVARGVEVTRPQQFFDIGYLCHLDDPDGYCIELLQHTFEWNHSPKPPLETEVLGNQPNLGQVSLNVSSIENSLAFYRDRLGMKVLSRQPVPDRGFTLWFLGSEEQTPPSSSIDAVENREWLWSLPGTTLELRETENPGSQRRAHPPGGDLGFRGMVFTHPDPHRRPLRDPDGVEIFLR